MTGRIRVGVVGANPEKSWASHTHLPAIRALPQFELQAVSTTNAASANRAAHVFGAPLAFDNAFDLATHPAVDLVTVAVRVPQHRDIVLAAVEAGKHVYCEWPLGQSLDESVALAEAARGRRVRTVIGLQGRASPWLMALRQFIGSGQLGRILSTSLVASAVSFGATASASTAYMLDKRNGATMRHLAFAHLLDSLLFAVGDLTELSALQRTQRTEVTLAGTLGFIPADGPDQIAVHGLHENGAVMSLHMRGGVSQGTNLLWEINGSEGDLMVSSDSPFVHLGRLALRLGRPQDGQLRALPVQETVAGVPAALLNGPAFNVACMYAQFARDIQEGTQVCPNFEEAVAHHRVLDMIEQAALQKRSLAAPDRAPAHSDAT